MHLLACPVAARQHKTKPASWIVARRFEMTFEMTAGLN